VPQCPIAGDANGAATRPTSSGLACMSPMQFGVVGSTRDLSTAELHYEQLVHTLVSLSVTEQYNQQESLR